MGFTVRDREFFSSLLRAAIVGTVIEPDNFALVPKPPSAIEKVEPGAKRVLSGMVADTLALVKKKQAAKPVLIVLLGFGSRDRFKFFEEGLNAKIGEEYELKLTHFENESELLQMVQQPFDLTFAFCNPIINWETYAKDSLKAVELLEELRTQCRKPIIVPFEFSAELTKRLEIAGVHTFRHTPFSNVDFWNTLQDYLNVPRSPANDFGQASLQPSRVRPPKIVMLDDEPMLLEMYEIIIPPCYPNACLLTFNDAVKAWEELLREDPDLFVTDWAHPKMHGGEMLQLLGKRMAKYPIWVISGFASAEDILMYAGPNLNVTFLRKPFIVETLTDELAKHFGLGNSPQKQVLIRELETETLALQTTHADFSMKLALGKCPACGSNVFENDAGYFCERSQAISESCKFKVRKVLLQQTVNREQMQKLLKTGKTDLLDNWISKAGMRFAAYLVINSGRIMFEFPPHA